MKSLPAIFIRERVGEHLFGSEPSADCFSVIRLIRGKVFDRDWRKLDLIRPWSEERLVVSLNPMNLTDIPPSLRDHFEQSPEVLAGKLRVRGSRVSVEQVLELLEAGVAPSDITKSFPSLDLAAVNAVERLAAHCALAML